MKPALLTQSYLCYPRLKIVDDDIDWKQMVTEENEIEEDEEEAPVVGSHFVTLCSPFTVKF